jgi:hypothetical protein
MVNYPALDQGRTRVAFNATLHRAAAPSPAEERELWDAIDRHQEREDLEGLRRIHRPEADDRERRVLELMEARKRKLKNRRGPPR